MSAPPHGRRLGNGTYLASAVCGISPTHRPAPLRTPGPQSQIATSWHLGIHPAGVSVCPIWRLDAQRLGALLTCTCCHDAPAASARCLARPLFPARRLVRPRLMCHARHPARPRSTSRRGEGVSRAKTSVSRAWTCVRRLARPTAGSRSRRLVHPQTASRTLPGRVSHSAGCISRTASRVRRLAHARPGDVSLAPNRRIACSVSRAPSRCLSHCVSRILRQVLRKIR